MKIDTISTVLWLIFSAVTILGLPIWKGSYCKWEWKDMWQGIYFGEDATYVCFIPFLVFVFPKNHNENSN